MSVRFQASKDVRESRDNANLNPVIFSDGTFIPIVDKFVYLGSYLTRDCSDDMDVKERIDAAGGAFGNLRDSLFSSPKISPDAKRIVYIGLILSILLYGSECWSLTEKLYNSLRCFHARCIRAMCRVTRYHTRHHRISTEQLMDRLKILEMDTYISRRQLRWAGHIARMDFSRQPRMLLSSWVPAPRPRGCPEFTYGRGLMKSLQRNNIDTTSWFEIAQSREEWHSIISNL